MSTTSTDGHVHLTQEERDALRARYRLERDKRLRADGNAQYLEPKGRFAHFVEDPYVQKVERQPVRDDVTVAFIGGGFAGLCTGARMKQAGIDDFHIIEGGGDFGGVWYWNRYPGAMCDTAAMVYLPLMEEVGTRPTMKYVFAPEIWRHALRIAEVFNLRQHALFSTNVTLLEWDDAASRWIIHTDRGDRIRARFVAMGTGPLHKPKLPGIPGIESFAGHAFHTSRWDYAWTGGDPNGAPMTKLADKRVGIIGTGATSVQCIPPLGRDAKELFVFQRTPSSIDVRNNHPLDGEWFTSLKPGWQKEWLMNFATLQTGGFADEDLVKDGWTDIAIRVRDRVIQEMGAGGNILDMETIQKAFENTDDEKMTEIRARVDAIVRDPKTAEKLKPWYRQLCKRPCFHDEYLQTFNRSNVHLVDTDGLGVERIDATGVWANGVHYDLDCLVFASGFEFATEFSRRTGFETKGRGGETLSNHWRDGMQTLHGIHVHGFPNLFIVGLVQGGGLISNITHNLVEAGTTITAIIKHALAEGAEQVEATSEAEQAWVEQIANAPQSLFGNPDCTPGYYNNEGQAMGRREKLNVGSYPLGPVAYFQYIDDWRASGAFRGLTFRKPPAAAARAS
jgi:cation diffusion facilitator CzcD-associated flavoprotein CzcO